jgi:acyl-coenzyme A synthetase/AMP-(fatty) acid ligase
METHFKATPDFTYSSQEKHRNFKLLLPGLEISFDGLQRASGDLAKLIASTEAGDILVCLPFGPSYYVALVACMRAGRPVVPIDPSLSKDVQRDQIGRINPALAIVEKGHEGLEWLPCPTLNIPTLAVSDQNLVENNSEWITWDAYPDELPMHRLFTSGSSGKQTLVTISRGAIRHDVSTTSALYVLTATETLCNVGRYTSSMHINAFWRCLHKGTSFIPVDLKSESASDILQRCKHGNLGILQGHPSLLDVLFNTSQDPIPVPTIHHLIVGGEPLKVGWLARIRRWLPELKMITHNFSSTETMIIACGSYSIADIEGLVRFPAGFPTPGKMVRIIDETGQELPVGDVGEISVSSRYIGSKMEGSDAHSRFHEDPITGIRTWNTRDLGRWLPDGSLEHLGRADRQMKINGQRIDPVFIEQYMETLEGIDRSIVFAIHKENVGQQLVAVYQGSEHIAPSAIRSYLSDRLPAGHYPSGIFKVDNIPVTPRGKPDLNALEKFVREQWTMTSDDYALSQVDQEDPIRQFLQDSWIALLPTSSCDPARSVFDQGADSVMLIKMASLISDKLNLRINIAFLLEHPTLNAQSTALREMMHAASKENISELHDQDSRHFF